MLDWLETAEKRDVIKNLTFPIPLSIYLAFRNREKKPTKSLMKCRKMIL